MGTPNGKIRTNPIDWKSTDVVTCVELNYKTPDPEAQAEEPGVILKDVYHFLYGSQLYGTTFGVYGKFKVSNDLKVVGVDLQLLNYNGVVNIGFCDVQPADVLDNSPIEHLYIGVKAGSTAQSIFLKVTDHRTGDDSAIQLTQGKHKRIKMFRVLYPLDEFGIKPGVGEDQLINDLIPNTPLFDTEFHHRSGIDYYNGTLRPGMAGCPIPRFVSIRCHESNINLLFS